MNNVALDWFKSLSIPKQDLDVLVGQCQLNIGKIECFTQLLNGQLSKDQVVSFDESATKIIDRLFTQYVNDDTLVITSSSEHPSVYNNLQKCKHVLKLFSVCGYNNDVHLEDELKKFKTVFVYIIGLSSGDNFYCSNEWFLRLKSALVALGKPHIFTIDAVQELFLLPRDYSMFDYVIGTAHALIPWYNRGIVVSKGIPFTPYTEDNMLYSLVKTAQLYKDQLAYFNYVMQQEFSYELMTDKALSVSNNSPFIFNLMDKKCRLGSINDEIFVPAGVSMESTPATFRAFNALAIRDKFKQSLAKTHYLLSQ